MRRPSFLWAAICLSLAGTPAFAQSTSSGAYTVSADETVSTAGIVTANVDVGPIAPSSGAAPPSYNNSNSVLTLTESASLTTGLGGVTQGLQTGLLTSNANGTATGAEATSTVNNFLLSVAGLSNLLSVSATTIDLIRKPIPLAD